MTRRQEAFDDAMFATLIFLLVGVLVGALVLISLTAPVALLIFGSIGAVFGLCYRHYLKQEEIDE